MKKKIFILLFSFLFFNIFSLKANSIDSLENLLRIYTGEKKLHFISDLALLWKKTNNSRAEEILRGGIELSISLNKQIHQYKLSQRLGAILSHQNRYEEGLCYLNESLDFFKRVKNESEVARVQLDIATMHSNYGQYSKADSILLVILKYAEEMGESALSADILISRGTNFLNQDNLESAKASYSQAMEISIAQNDSVRLGYLYNNLGIIKIETEDFTGALDYYFQAFGINSELHLQSLILNNIGIVYEKLEDWEKALEYQERALRIKENIGLPLLIANGLNNIGIIHKNMLNYGKAMEAFRKSLAIKTKLEGDNNHIGLNFNNIGIVHSRMEAYDSAFIYYEKYLDLANKKGNIIGICRASYNISHSLSKQGKFEESIKYALDGLSIAEANNNIHYRKVYNDLLAYNYEELNDFKMSLFHKKKFDAINDSILNLQKLRKVISLENEKNIKDLEKEVFEKEQKIKALKTNHSVDISGSKLIIFIFSLLSIIGYFLFYNNRRKNEIKSSFQNKSENEITDDKLKLILKEYFDKLSTQISNQHEEKETQVASTETKITKMANFLVDQVKTKADWKDFINYFSHVHKDFFKDLKASYPQITAQELNLCSLMKLNLLNNEIGQILGISPESVRKAQYRLSKKININSIEELRTLIHKS